MGASGKACLQEQAGRPYIVHTDSWRWLCPTKFCWSYAKTEFKFWVLLKSLSGSPCAQETNTHLKLQLFFESSGITYPAMPSGARSCGTDLGVTHSWFMSRVESNGFPLSHESIRIKIFRSCLSLGLNRFNSWEKYLSRELSWFIFWGNYSNHELKITF